MGRFGGYYKGEKKKSKRTFKEKVILPGAGSVQTFKLPEIIERRKKDG